MPCDRHLLGNAGRLWSFRDHLPIGRLEISKKLSHSSNLLRRRRPAQRKAISEIHPPGVIKLVFAQHPFGQRKRLPAHKRIVQQVQCLRRYRRGIAPAGHHALIGEVEHFERRRRDPAQQGKVNTAMKTGTRECRQLIGLRPVVREFSHFQFIGRGSLRPGEIELSRSGEGRVANFLGVEPARAVPPEEAVGWIDRRVCDRLVGSELIRMRQNDRAHQLLDRPALADESARQVIQQFRVRRAISGDAKVIDALDQTLAEQMFPDPVHHDARRERIVRTAEPLGELQPPAMGGGDGGLTRKVDDAEESARRDRPEFFRFAANANFGVAHRFWPRARPAPQGRWKPDRKKRCTRPAIAHI